MTYSRVKMYSHQQFKECSIYLSHESWPLWWYNGERWYKAEPRVMLQRSLNTLQDPAQYCNEAHFVRLCWVCLQHEITIYKQLVPLFMFIHFPRAFTRIQAMHSFYTIIKIRHFLFILKTYLHNNQYLIIPWFAVAKNRKKRV